MSARRLDIVVVGILCAGLGVAGGMLGSGKGTAKKSAGGHGGHGHGHGTHDDHGDEEIVFDAATLENLGVQVGKAKKTTFVRRRKIPAVVKEMPFTEQPLFAPFGGRIQSIFVKPGQVVNSDQVLMTVLRDKLPRPSLQLTEDILKPATEQIHSAVGELRRAYQEKKINAAEMNRIRKFSGASQKGALPILPGKTIVNLQYAKIRVESAYQSAVLDLEKHGFSETEIQAIAEGGTVPQLTEHSWRRALKVNGLWSIAAEQLYAGLPEKVRSLRWGIAAIGELSAGGFISSELIDWLKNTQSAGKQFLAIGGLLQEGHSVAEIKSLFNVGALEPVIKIRAPQNKNVADWDVHDVAVKPGAKVEAGDELLKLLNPRKLYLQSIPVGGEKADLLQAVSNGGSCTAAPLVEGVGPKLKGLKVSFITGGHENGSSGTIAYIEVENKPLSQKKENESRPFRSWQLRPGMKYVLGIPVSEIKNVFVVPSDAVTNEGPKSVVFLRDGNSFKSVSVQVAYRDHQSAVIPINKHTDIFEGDPIVLSGAFALGLAINSGDSGIDPHAGHSH